MDPRGVLGCALSLAVAAVALQGCDTAKEVAASAVTSAKNEVTDIICDDVVSGAVKAIEDSSVTLLESLCREWPSTNGTHEHADAEDECLGEGGKCIEENLKTGRGKLDRQCAKFVAAKLISLERNGKGLMENMWNKTAHFATKWFLEAGDALSTEVWNTTAGAVSARAQHLPEGQQAEGRTAGVLDADALRSRQREIVAAAHQDWRKRSAALLQSATDDLEGKVSAKQDGNAQLLSNPSVMIARFSTAHRIRGTGGSAALHAFGSSKAVLGVLSILLSMSIVLVGVRRRRCAGSAHSSADGTEVEEKIPFAHSPAQDLHDDLGEAVEVKGAREHAQYFMDARAHGQYFQS